eukprot:3618760-Amphidinium_carterae.2
MNWGCRVRVGAVDIQLNGEPALSSLHNTVLSREVLTQRFQHLTKSPLAWYMRLALEAKLHLVILFGQWFCTAPGRRVWMLRCTVLLKDLLLGLARVSSTTDFWRGGTLLDTDWHLINRQ